MRYSHDVVLMAIASTPRMDYAASRGILAANSQLTAVRARISDFPRHTSIDRTRRRKPSFLSLALRWVSECGRLGFSRDDRS